MAGITRPGIIPWVPIARLRDIAETGLPKRQAIVGENALLADWRQPAARYANQKSAGVAYLQAQAAIYKADCEILSTAFSSIASGTSRCLGSFRPITSRNGSTLPSRSETVFLPADILAFLRLRRADAVLAGPWVKGHYQPGRQPQ